MLVSHRRRLQHRSMHLARHISLSAQAEGIGLAGHTEGSYKDARELPQAT